MKNLLAFALIFFAYTFKSYSQTVTIESSGSIPDYGIQKLYTALLQEGYKAGGKNAEYVIAVTLNSSLGTEAFSIAKDKKTITISGGDERGIIYGCLDVAESISNKTSLLALKNKQQKPHLALRAVKFDLPWDTYRHSTALDLHDQTCRDTAYWKAFLDMMAENRLNSLSLWNLHTYPFNFSAKCKPRFAHV